MGPILENKLHKDCFFVNILTHCLVVVSRMQNQKAKCICSKIYLRNKRKKSEKITFTIKRGKKFMTSPSFLSLNVRSLFYFSLKFIYCEKATNFYEISALHLTYVERSNLRWRFRKILSPSQNIGTLQQPDYKVKIL